MQRMEEIKINVYTKSRIERWEEQLRVIPAEIKKNEENIIASKTELLGLNAELEDKITIIAQKDTEIKGIKSRIEIIEKNKSILDLKKIEPKNTDEISRLTPELSLLDGKIDPLNNEIKILSQWIAIKDAQRSLKEASDKKLQNENEKLKLDNHIIKQRHHLREVLDKLNDINSKISQLKDHIVRQDNERSERDKRQREKQKQNARKWERQEQEIQESEKQEWSKCENDTQIKERLDWEAKERMRRELEDKIDREERDKYEHEINELSHKYNNVVSLEKERHDKDLIEIRKFHEIELLSETKRHENELKEEKERHERELQDLGWHRNLGFHRGLLVQNTHPMSYSTFAPSPWRHEQGDDKEQERIEIEKRHRHSHDRLLENQRLEHMRLLREQSEALQKLEAQYHQQCQQREECFIRDRKEREHKEQERQSNLSKERTQRLQAHQEFSRREHERREQEHQVKVRVEIERRRYEHLDAQSKEHQFYMRSERDRRELERPERERKERELSELKLILNSTSSQKSSINEAISQLEHDINNCESSIKNEKNIIKDAYTLLNSMSYSDIKLAAEKELSTLEGEKERCIQKRDAFAIEKHQLFLKIKCLEGEIKNANDLIKQYDTRIQEISLDAAPFVSMDSSLDVLLEERLKDRLQLVQIKINLEIQIEKHHGIISEANKKIQEYHMEYGRLNREDFLIQLRDNPKAILDSLVNKVYCSFEKYDNDHPADQSEIVQICLAEMLNTVKTILNKKALTGESEEEPGQVKSLLDNPIVKQYYLLSGYLKRIQARIDYPKKNIEFGNLIDSILGQFILDSQESLAIYQLADLPEMNKKEFITYLNQEYNDAYADLQVALLNTPEEPGVFRKLYVKGAEVAKTIQISSQQLLINEDTLDSTIPIINLNRRILHKTTLLLNKPNCKILQAEYRQLAMLYPSGQPSNCKKMAGAMLLFLGAALVVASIIFPTPLSTGGIVLGGAAMLAGFGIFRSGGSKGVVKKMGELLSTAKRVDKQDSSHSPQLETSCYQNKSSTTIKIEPSAPSFVAL